MTADPMAWLAQRVPTPPPEFAARLEVEPAQGRSVSRALGAAAVDRLSEVFARPGRDREGAFHLLAADALLTYACEASAGEEDVERSLVDLLELLRSDEDGSSDSPEPST